MNRCIAALNSAAQSWWPGTVHAFWQGLVALGIVLLALVLWRRAAPRWRYGLLLICLVKFALPPIGLPFGLFAWFPTPGTGGLSPAKPPAAIASAAPQKVTANDKASFDTTSFDSPPSAPAALPPVHAISSNSPPSSKPLLTAGHSAPSAPAPRPTFTLAGWLFLAQVLGALGLLGFVLSQAAFLRRRMRKAETICSGPLYELASAVAGRIGLRRVPRLCLVPRVQCPQAGGFRRSFALLPEWVRDASEEDRRALIAHELAHLRRGDPWVNAFQIAVQIWLWWNPAVWWLNRRIRTERELCCDDMVLTLGLAQGENYSRLLVGVAERLSRRELALEMVGMADAFRPVRQRVRRALDAGLKRPVRFSVISLVSLLMLACVVLPGTLSSQEPSAPVETPEPGKPADFTEPAKPATAPTPTSQPSFDPAPVFKRNRAWLKPDLDRLQSVSFTHSMASMRLDERFVWRRDGASLLEVVYRDDESSATEVGRRWITTSEPAQYYMKPKARLAKRENTDAAFFPKYFRDHLMGTRTRFTALEWGWNPDSFAIRNVEKNKAEKTLTIRLAPSDSKFSINAGAMFHTTSWAYVPDVRIARSEITIDPADHRILREVDYSGDGAKQCQIQFLDWQETGGGCAVPRLINLRFPSSEFEVVYRFQWRPEGLWILEKGESRFKKEAEPQRETIQDLKINQPTPELDQPLQVVADSRRYLQGEAAKSRDLSLEVNPFALGRILEIRSESSGKPRVSFRDLIFTLNDSGELIARINLQRQETKQTEPGTASLLLFDEGGSCPLAAAQKEFLFPADNLTSSVTVLFGKSDPLGKSKFFHLTLLSGANNASETGNSREKTSLRAVPVYPFGLAKAIALDLADSAGGKTRLKQALFERNGTGELIANLELISQDEWKRFPVLLSLTLLGPDGKVKAASSREVPFQVENEIAEVKAVFNLGSGLKPDAIQSFAVGLARGANTGMYHGHDMWMTFISEDKRLFPVEQMLEAPDDPQLRTMGLRALNQDIRDRKMRYELFSDERDRQRAQERGWTRVQQLAPHLGRLESLLGKTDDPEALALLCRLLGHSGEKRFVEPLKRLLADSRPTVRDGAAIGLGLLGDAAGFDRLAPILSLKLPEDVNARGDLQDLQTDAAIALGVIGGDDAVRALGKAFVSAVEGIIITPGIITPEGRGGGYSIGGTYDLASKLVFILERTRNPLILPYLKEALHCGGQRGEHVSREIAETLKGFKERKETLDVIVEGIRQGNSYILREAPKDPALLSEVGAMILREGTDAWTFDYGVQFLMELNDPKALEPLREARKRNLFPENTEARLNLAAALIAYGDYQAFEDGFDALRIIMNPGTLIVEERESEMEERARKAKSLFDKIAGMPADETTKRLKPRLESEDRNTLNIALQIVEHLPKVPEGLKTAVEQALPPALTVTQSTPNLLGSLVPEGGCKAEKTTTQTIMASHWRQQAPRLVTPDRYRPPFALTVQAMTDTTNIRLYYGSVAEGLVILNWEVRPTELRIHDLLTGQAQAVPGKGSVSKNEWHTIRWEIAAAEMRVFVDGELRYQAKGEFAGLARPLGIGPALGSTVSVRSFVVEPLPAPSERL